MPASFYDSMQGLKEKGLFYCPAGHEQQYTTGELEVDVMRRERDRAI